MEKSQLTIFIFIFISIQKQQEKRTNIIIVLNCIYLLANGRTILRYNGVKKCVTKKPQTKDLNELLN